MEQAERNRIIAEQKTKQDSSLEAHVAALEALASTTNFNFDVATDIHPHLMENSEEGIKQLQRWQEFYAALAKGPQAVTTLRWSTGLAPGCYGFGQEPQYQTQQLWVHVYEGVTAEDIVFTKGNDGEPSRVSIRKPHDMLEWNVQQGLITTDLDEAVLYQQELRHPTEVILRGQFDEWHANHDEFVYGEHLKESARNADRRLEWSGMDINTRVLASHFLFNQAYADEIAARTEAKRNADS